MKTKFLLLASVITLNIFAQSGSLDNTFGINGIVNNISIGSVDDRASSLAVQPDGKILVAGYSNNGANADFAIVRHNSDGSLDDTFGIDGIVTTTIGIGNDYPQSIALQSDGKIVVAGYSIIGTNYDFVLVRYNSDGSLDNTFDTDGRVTTDIVTKHDFATSVVLQSDGKIVMAGYSGTGANFDFALLRYNSDGSLDNTFDTDGIVTTHLGMGLDYANSVALQSDGKIIVAGSFYNGTNTDFAIVRYNSDGSLDNTFETDGIVTTTIGSANDIANSVALQSDGKIVVAGGAFIGTNTDFALVRYNSDGSLDNTFDTDGIVTTTIVIGYDIAKSVAVQADEKIVVAGFFNNGTNNDFAIARYNSNGSLDNTFDTDGIVTTDIGSFGAFANAIVLQSDGKIIVAGYWYFINRGQNNFVLVRYNNDVNSGISDNVEENNGELTLYPNPAKERINFVTTANGKNTLTIYNAVGQIVKQVLTTTQQTSLTISDMPNGIYFCELKNGDGMMMERKKFIVDK